MSSRVAHHIDFPDYTPDGADGDRAADARAPGLRALPGCAAGLPRVPRAADAASPRFAHARSVRNAIERARLRHANRVYEAATSRPTHDELDAHRGGRTSAPAASSAGAEERCRARSSSASSATRRRARRRSRAASCACSARTHVTHVCTDDYHRYDRRQRAELGITPLHPDCNHLDIIAQHLRHLRRGEPILKPVYRHQDGTFGAAGVRQARALHGDRGPARLPPAGDARRLRRARVPEPARGAAAPVEGAARLLAARLHDRPGAGRARSARARLRGVHPAAASATPTWSCRSRPGDDGGPRPPRRRADPARRPPAPGSVAVHRRRRATASTLVERDGERLLRIPGEIDPEHAAAIEEAIWDRMHFATHLRAAGSASSRSAPSCTAPSRWRSCSC